MSDYASSMYDFQSSSNFNELLKRYEQLMDPRIKLSEDQWNRIFSALNDTVVRASGWGSLNSQLQNTYVGIDRYNMKVATPNSELSGLTFITRPRLNLSTMNIRQNRILSTLETQDNQSANFVIRHLLDTNLASESTDMKNSLISSPLINHENPFLVPVMNCLTQINGFPDIVLDNETVGEGFHNEDWTFVKGHDFLNKTYDINMAFKDILGGPIINLFYYWMIYCALQNKGLVFAYSDDVYEQRLNYTVSIYRFVLDPSRQNIVKWAKATGCFPRALPIGACFDVNEGTTFVDSSIKFSIPFTANKVEYNDYAILADFNILMQRYCNDIIDTNKFKDIPTHPSIAAQYNFMGLPFITYDNNGPHLTFRYRDTGNLNPFYNSYTKVMSELNNSIEATHALNTNLIFGTGQNIGGSLDEDLKNVFA